MLISRKWSMPSAATFDVRPIKHLLNRWLAPGAVVVDPFARNSLRGTIRNDLDPSTAAQHHLPADEFAAKLLEDGIAADAVLFDPPYSPRQLMECYKAAHRQVGQRETQNASINKLVRDRLTDVLKPGGLAISCGWNSVGFGKKRGFDLLEVMIVCHGGAHNDTIVVVERKAEKAVGRAVA